MLWLEEQDPLISLHHSGVSFVTAIPDIYWVFAVCQPLFFLFKKIFVSSSEDIFSFLLEREEKRENHQCEREASIGCLPNAPRPGTVHSLTGDGNHSLGMCPEQEPNPQPFGYGTMLQPTEPHWPVLYFYCRAISPFISVNICFLIFRYFNVGCPYIHILCILLTNWPL